MKRDIKKALQQKEDDKIKMQKRIQLKNERTKAERKRKENLEQEEVDNDSK